MIELQRTQDERRVTFVTRPPLVYLDQWALNRIARHDLYCRRFLRTLHKHGTLMFSWAAATEVTDLPDQSQWRLRAFLDAVGEHWFPLEILPEAVRARESSPGENSPCFDEELVRQYAPQIPAGERFTLSWLVDLAADPRNEARAELAECKTEFVTQLAEQRKLEQESPGRAARVFRSEPFDPRRPVRFVLHAVYRDIIADRSWAITEDDSVRLLQAVVASAYCDFMVLEPSWFKRAKNWPLPHYRVHFYSEGTLEKFLDDFDRRTT